MANKKNETNTEPNPTCGIVMPISAMDNCSAEHWGDVLTILRETVQSAGFEPNLVSDADDVGIIQKTIVQNIYNNDIVICDVSAKNPNVMFELGMRLAFDKATIIIKDDRTDYSFDTGVIEHVGYPRDLRFNKINDFKEKLKTKLIATYEKSKNDPNYSTFLKSFGEYRVASLQTKEISSEDYILESLKDLKFEFSRLRRDSLITQRNMVRSSSHLTNSDSTIGIGDRNYGHDSNCIRATVIEFARENELFSGKELKERLDDIIEFVKNDEHVRETHGPETNIIRTVKNFIGYPYLDEILIDARERPEVKPKFLLRNRNSQINS